MYVLYVLRCTYIIKQMLYPHNFVVSSDKSTNQILLLNFMCVFMIFITTVNGIVHKKAYGCKCTEIRFFSGPYLIAYYRC